jgi:hypothetical protein
MEEKKIKLEGLPEMTEEEALLYVLEKIRGRDLFPERTAYARKLLQNINGSLQNLIP